MVGKREIHQPTELALRHLVTTPVATLANDGFRSEKGFAADHFEALYPLCSIFHTSKYCHSAMLISRVSSASWTIGVSKFSKFSSCVLSVASRGYATSFEEIQSELLSRRLPLLYDAPTETPSYLLDATLEDFLPPSPVSVYPTPPRRKRYGRFAPLRPGHHLVYFPPGYPLSALLPDGTDPAQSPGEPFVRRMWAGGRIQFFPNRLLKLRLSGHKATCLERISNVSAKGSKGEEKIFVTIERRFTGTLRKAIVSPMNAPPTGNAALLFQDRFERAPGKILREHLMKNGNCSLIEERDIVFMRDRTPEEAAEAAVKQSRVVKPAHEPSYSVTLTPSPALLFRFSALTFNAHRIHLDKAYCRDMEGHRNLLVHGPLSLVLMLELLNRHLAEHNRKLQMTPFVVSEKAIESVEYRNVAPLYAEEPMKVCLRSKGDDEYDLWVENKDGGLAVKGTAKTITVRNVVSANSRRGKGIGDREIEDASSSLEPPEAAMSHSLP